MLQLLQTFVDNIVPILIVAALGYWVGRRFNIAPEPVGTLVFNILSPALVFRSLYTNRITGGEFIALFAITVVYQVIMAGIAAVLARAQGADAVDRAAVVISAFCFNAGNFGLSVVSFAFGNEFLSRAIVVMVANQIVNYSLGVYIASSGKSSAGQAILKIFRTPAIYAALAAFVLLWLGIQLPRALERSVNTLADASIPLMLLVLGLQLGQFTELRKRNLIATGVGLRLLLGPLVAFGLAFLFGLNESSRIAFIAQASMPTAIITIIFATEFELDRELSLNLILASTLLSPLTLTVLVSLLK